MVFSDQSTEHVYHFPYYEYFKDAIDPLLEQVGVGLGVREAGCRKCAAEWSTLPAWIGQGGCTL